MKKRNRTLLAAAGMLTLLIGLAVPALALSRSRTVTVYYDDIRLVVNGKTVTPKDGDGDTVEPFIIDGTTYLPVRAVANALGLDVDWDDDTNTVTLTGSASQSTGSSTSTSTSGLITEEAAQKAALSHAGVSASDATIYKTKLDWDDGRQEYEVDFYTDTYKYDYEIDARTGEVLTWDQERRSSASGTNTSGAMLTREEAKALLQDKAPNATLIELKLDYDDGRAVYEGEMRDGYIEYEFEIDAYTGAFLKWEADR